MSQRFVNCSEPLRKNKIYKGREEEFWRKKRTRTLRRGDTENTQRKNRGNERGRKRKKKGEGTEDFFYTKKRKKRENGKRAEKERRTPGKRVFSGTLAFPSS